MQTITGHDDIVRQEFTKQAASYAANPDIADRERSARLVQALAPSSQDRILEVATGPGYVALALAAFAREVVGVDLTEAPLAIAEKTRDARGLHNVRFQTANANHLPFPDAAFDAVVCRFAFHHFERPSLVMRDMVRVCKPGGRVAVEDLVVSEHAGRATYHNHLETLRDPSHTAALPLSRLLISFAEAGLEVEQVQTSHLTQVAERWLRNAQTPDIVAQQVRDLLERDALHDLSGTRPMRNQEGQLCFTQRTAIVVGRKLHPPA